LFARTTSGGGLVNRQILFVIAVLLAAFGWWRIVTHAATRNEWQGYVEADFVKVAPTQQGLLTQVMVARGDRVSKGQPLFTQDDTSDLAARDQVSRQLQQSQAQLGNLLAPGKLADINQAEANIADAQAARDKAEMDLRRNESLLPAGGVSLQVVEEQRADLRSADARLQAMSAALALQTAPLGRHGEIKAQQAAIDAATAALIMAQWRLDQRQVKAPDAGVVADVLARQGETVAAGAPVVSILSAGNIFVRFFVPEEHLVQVHAGDQVQFVCDDCPANLIGHVSFIAPQAEYTPPVIYSDANRAKLVYLVEARPSLTQAARLNPGQPITVRPIAGHDGHE
jgi:HlyD family secretion protein